MKEENELTVENTKEKIGLKQENVAQSIEGNNKLKSIKAKDFIETLFQMITNDMDLVKAKL